MFFSEQNVDLTEYMALEFCFLSTRSRLIYSGLVISKIAKGAMTYLIRQNLGKSTLNLRILCLAFIIITVRSVVSDEDTCSVNGFAKNNQQHLCFHKSKINKPVCCVAIKCPEGKHKFCLIDIFQEIPYVSFRSE